MSVLWIRILLLILYDFEWKIWNIEKVIVSVVVLHQLATDLFEFVML